MDFNSRKETTIPFLVVASNDASLGQKVSKRSCSTLQIDSILHEETVQAAVRQRCIALGGLSHKDRIKATFMRRRYWGHLYSGTACQKLAARARPEGQDPRGSPPGSGGGSSGAGDARRPPEHPPRVAPAGSLPLREQRRTAARQRYAGPAQQARAARRQPTHPAGLTNPVAGSSRSAAPRRRPAHGWAP